MTKDLEETLREMGAEYRPVVDRLVAAFEPVRAEDLRPQSASSHRGRIVGWSTAYLVAASLLVLVGVAALFRGAGNASRTGAVPRNEYALAQYRSEAAVAEIIRTQNPDGSWKTDFLTRQNAAALKLYPSEAARVAYRKAMRNMRARHAL